MTNPLAAQCGHTPEGQTWPVCALPEEHAGDHESADFRWSDTGGYFTHDGAAVTGATPEQRAELDRRAEPVTTPGAALDVPFTAQIEQLLAPHTISLTDWVRGILSDDDFPEADPEAATLGMLAQILTARTSEEVLASMELNRAHALAGGEPGGHSPLLEIRAARPIRSDYEDGAACYCIVDAAYVHNGETVRFTTGARAVQAAIVAHIGNGWMPFRAILEIRRERTRSGFYPLNLVAGG